MQESGFSLVPIFRSPSTRADLLQVLKAVLAAVAAWVIAADLLEMSSAFLAPWTALLTVHATVYRSFARGAQAVAATVLGVLLSFGIVAAIGPSAAALGLALLVGLLLGRLTPIRDEGSTVATTALFILTTGQADEATMLVDRLGSTGIGVIAGVVVNLVVFAPLDYRAARSQVDAVCRGLGHLLGDMARELVSSAEDVDLEDFIDRSRRLDEDLGHAWELVRHTREARIGNPRPSSRGLEPDTYTRILTRLEDGVTHARAIARTIDQSRQAPETWAPHFRDAWIPLLESLGDRLYSPDATVASLRPDLEALVTDLSGEGLPGDHWPAYGSLIDSTLSIVDVVDDVASSRHVRD